MKISVNVTQECIDSGIRKDVCGCPVALALKEIGYEDAAVGLDGCYLNLIDDENSEQNKYYPFPLEVKKFIKTFDSSENVSPISFELDTEKYLAIEDLN